MGSSLAPRPGRLYRRMAADAAGLRPRLPWMRCEAWQYSTAPAVTRWQPRWGAAIWHLPGDDLIPDPATASGSRP
jgi:hypothetical protein